MIGADGYRRMVSSIRLEMLELLGKPYIIDHVRSEVRKHQERQLFMDYVADTIGALGGCSSRYSDLAELHFPLMNAHRDTRTAEEITADNAKGLAELCGGGETA